MHLCGGDDVCASPTKRHPCIQVGQQIAIVTTYARDSVSNQNEVRTITGVNGNTVTFAQPLQFAHYGYCEGVVLLVVDNASPPHLTTTEAPSTKPRLVC
jgi:hypothetical protein